MLIQIIIWIIVIYVLFGLYLFFFQRNFIYYPTKQDFYACPSFSDSQKIEFKGTRFYYKKNSEKLAVFYHGNAGSACDRGYIKKIFSERDYSFIIAEYAGYSNDTRKPSQDLILEDARNINEFITETSYSRLIILGESIGSSVAAYHASISQADKVLLLSPFNSLREFAKSYYPLYPVRFLLKENYPSEEWLKRYKGEVMIIHGTDDSIVPIELAKKLYKSIPSAKEFIEIEGAGHNNLFLFNNTQESIKKFLE